ncbi:MAG: (4Fe-4S)-binding protein [Bacteroidetes bacterium]|nr:(4Fe-4S)-binding protein [Bacteroidota bacterium]
MKREYKIETVAVVWDAEKCQHSGNCARGLPRVFRPKAKPWIQVDHATEQEIIDQVAKCPSGALSIRFLTE